MPAAFGSDSVVAYGTRTNTPITAPSGIASGDKLVIKLLIGGFGVVPTVTPPAGFTEITDSPYPLAVESGGFNLQAHLYWRDADSESGDYTLTHASANTAAWMARITGAASGAPTATGATSPGTTPTAPGATPSGAGAFFAFWASSFNFLGAVTPPGTPPTFTERLDSGASILYVATGEMGAAEPSGDKSVTITEAPSMAGLVMIEAAVGVIIELEGICGGRSSVTGALGVVRSLEGRVTGQSSVHGAVNVIRGLAGRVSGSSLTRGTVGVLRELAGRAQGIARAIGSLFTEGDSVSIEIEITDEPTGRCVITDEATGKCTITDEAAI